MLTYSEHVLRICVAQLAKYAGWKSINSVPFEILIDILSRFILEFGKLSVSFANQCNRTQVNSNDIHFALKSMGFNLVDLCDYLENVKLPFAGPLIPQYPVKNPFKKAIRIQFPTRIECENREQYYQDWQPTLNSDKFLNKLEFDSEIKQEIENTLEQLDLVDFIEQKQNLKITKDRNLNKKIIKNIRTGISKLNIGNFTELTALVPNYIYLSPDGQPLSFGGKEGKSPEAKQHNQVLSNQDCKLASKIKNSYKLSSKKKRSLKKSDEFFEFKNKIGSPLKLVIKKNKKKKKKEKSNSSNLFKKTKFKSYNQFEFQEHQTIKTDEQIVSQLLNEMISHIEDNKVNESFYDENEAAKTLVLLSYDSSSKSVKLSNHSTSVDEKNQIDYSKLNNKINYDLNNNYSIISDVNNNSIGVSDSSQISNGFSKLERNFNDHEPLKFNDVKNLPTNKDNLDEEDNLDNKMNYSSNLPKLKFKFSFDKYKKGDALSLVNNSEYFHTSSNQQVSQSPNLNNDHHNSANSSTNEQLDTHQKKATKEDKRKKKGKKFNNITDHDDVIKSNKTKSKKNKEKNNKKQVDYYCPCCLKPDDGTPMIACDQCNSWYHWSCQNILVLPKEDDWYCSNCLNLQQVSIKSSKKLNKKTKSTSEEKSATSDKKIKKRSKDVQKEEDKSLQKSLSKRKKKDKSFKEDKNSDLSETYYCPSCSKPDDGSPMIACDKCDNWFHYKCVNLTSTPHKNESWFCFNCSTKKKKKTK